MNAQPATIDVSEVLRRIRERVQARQASTTGQGGPTPIRTAHSATGRELRGLQNRINRCIEVENTVGAINPRRGGLANHMVQVVKRAMQRSLSWYTRSLKQFHAEVIGAFQEMQAEVESRKLAEVSLNWQVSALSKRTDEFFNAIRDLETRMRREMETIPGHWLSRVDSHVGPKANSHLWFNEPIVIKYDNDGNASWSGTTERIIEKSWLLRNLGVQEPGVKVLDVGCTESTVALELASNGYHVTGIDVREYPLRHPNLQFVCADVCNAPLSANFFDIAVALSTVEHIGLGAYGDPQQASDSRAVQEILRFLKPGGRLLITVPFGRRAVTPLHRIYDKQSLLELLAGFSALKLEFGAKLNEKTWSAPVSAEVAAGHAHDPETGAPGAVALAVCEKPRY